MIFDLITDFSNVLSTMPAEHSQRRKLELLERAIRRDIHFISRHPTTFFQCMWNTCWWIDCPQTALHYRSTHSSSDQTNWNNRTNERPSGHKASPKPPPLEQTEPRLSQVLETWRSYKETRTPGFLWIRSHRPPPIPLNTPLMGVLRGHSGVVSSVAFSPNNRHIASGSYDNTVRIWDATNGTILTILLGHEGRVTSVAYCADGTKIASGGMDNTVRIWDVCSGAELTVLRCEKWRKTGNVINSVAFSPEGLHLACGSSDRSVKIWDLKTGKMAKALRGHKGIVFSVAFSPDGRQIASAAGDHTIRLWDALSGAELAVLHGHEGMVCSVQFSLDGRKIVSGGGPRDKSVRIWDAKSGSQLRVLRGHDGPVTSAAFSPSGLQIASSAFTETLRIWDANSGAELALLPASSDIVVAFSSDGRWIVTGGRDVCVWDFEKALGQNVTSKREFATCAAFSPDGRHIASGSFESSLQLRDSSSGTEVAVLRGHKGIITSVAFSPDGRLIASGGGDSDKTVRLWDIKGEKELLILRGHKNGITCVTFSPDGQRIASGSVDKTVRVWDARSGMELAVLRGHEGEVGCVAFSPDGRRIVSGPGRRWGIMENIVPSRESKLRLWDATSGFELGQIHEGYPDGSSIIDFGLDGKSFYGVAFSPNGQLIAAGSDDDAVKVLNLASGLHIETIQGISDVSAITAGIDQYLFRAVSRGDETVVEIGQLCWIAAYFSESLRFAIASHPNNRTWAGLVMPGHLYIISLEGEAVLPTLHEQSDECKASVMPDDPALLDVQARECYTRGNKPGALKLFEEELRLRNARISTDPNDMLNLVKWAGCKICQGATLQDINRYEEAFKAYEVALPIYTRLLEADPSNAVCLDDLFVCCTNLAGLLRLMGRSEAKEWWQRARLARESLLHFGQRLPPYAEQEFQEMLPVFGGQGESSAGDKPDSSPQPK